MQFERLPLIPVRNTVVFPSTSIPLVVGRARSITALKEASKHANRIVVATQRVVATEEPRAEDIYSIGTLCKIERMTEMEQSGADSGFQVVVTGAQRFRISDFKNEAKYSVVAGATVPDVYSHDSAKTQALFNSLKSLSREVIELLPNAGEGLARLLDALHDATLLTHLCATYLNLPVDDKQKLLEEPVVEKRMELLLAHMQKERDVLILQKDIQTKMSERLSKVQRDALLREQMRTIKEELGETESRVRDAYAKKIENSGMPDEVRKMAEEELDRLSGITEASAEYQVIRNYLDWLTDLPWQASTRDVIDLKRAREILDEDHFGLEKVKKRILQFLAIAKLKNDLHGPILCLLGPPGVGKTSLCQSIAHALGRKFIQTSLGGIRDEAEIRGHRRTYVGSRPGRIIERIRRVAVNNPVFLLDEIDKLGISYMGDPASAMLEVLDPEQNRKFVDHYLDVPFDLSNVFFVTTANILDTIPAPLRDRMEIIELTGYTTAEKLEIAKRYLLPKQLREHGLSESLVKISDAALEKIIASYTREAGVRELSRQIAAVLRSVGEKVASAEGFDTTITPESIPDYLGQEKFFLQVLEREARPGLATGLAWTPQGGEVLFVESSILRGRGRLILTGQLGEVMKESARIALSVVRAESLMHNVEFDWGMHDVHIHVPAGAIPKDGPSAGVAVFVSLISLFLNKPVCPDIAMTGEITLSGAVLPVGGIKEKVIAGMRAGVREIIMPNRNEKDLIEVPLEVRKSLKFRFVSSIKEVAKITLGIGRLADIRLSDKEHNYHDSPISH